MTDRKALQNRYVRISSEDRSTGTPSKFTVNLPTTGKNIDSVTSYSVKYLECPNIFPNVPTYKNTLLLVKTTGAISYSVPITSGQYTLAEFLVQLKTDIDAVIADTVTVTASAQNVLLFTWAADTYAMTFTGSTIAPIIGLSADIAAAATSTMQNQVNLMGESAVYFHSRTLNPGGTTEADGQFSTFGVLALGGTPYGSTAFLYPPDLESTKISFRSQKSLRSVDMVIRDRSGNQLVLPANFSLSVMLKINYTG